MHYFDTHTHNQTVHRDVTSIVSIDIRKPFELNDSGYNQLYAVGVHPWHIDRSDSETINRLFDKVCQLAILPEIVAIGETGLDKKTAKSTNDFIFQQEIFISHAHLSEEVKKPLIIHCVKAWNELLHIHETIKPTMPWIVHGFRGKMPLAIRLLNAGFYLSFSIHYNIDSLKAAWAKRRLLLETDDNNIDIRNVYQQVAYDLSVSEQEISGEIEKILHFPLPILH
jgi:TatD DNase family protein